MSRVVVVAPFNVTARVAFDQTTTTATRRRQVGSITLAFSVPSIITCRCLCYQSLTFYSITLAYCQC
jgi:hypothetical protein